MKKLIVIDHFVTYLEETLRTYLTLMDHSDTFLEDKCTCTLRILPWPIS